jgi:hypothetical protein
VLLKHFRDWSFEDLTREVRVLSRIAGTSVHYMWRYSYNLRSLYETLQRTDDVAEEMHSTARTEEVLRPVREQNRRLLTESSRDVLHSVI